MSEPLKKLEPPLTSLNRYEREIINAAIDRINELEAKFEHVHEYEGISGLTSEPLVSGEDNEGREVWRRPL